MKSKPDIPAIVLEAKKFIVAGELTQEVLGLAPPDSHAAMMTQHATEVLVLVEYVQRLESIVRPTSLLLCVEACLMCQQCQANELLRDAGRLRTARDRKREVFAKKRAACKHEEWAHDDRGEYCVGCGVGREYVLLTDKSGSADG